MAEFWEGSPEVEETDEDTDQAPAQEDWWAKSAPVKDQQEEWWSKSKAVESEPEAESAPISAARAAAHQLAPMAAGIAAGVPGKIAGATVGRVIGGTLGSWGGPIGTAGGMLIGGALGSYAQEKVLNLLGYDDSHQMAVDAKAHPIATGVGEAAGVLPFFGVGAVPKMARVAGGALVGGIEGARQLYEGDFEPGRLLSSAATGAVLAKPTALTEAIESRVGGMLGQSAAVGAQHGTAGPKAQAPSEPVPPLPRDSATQETQNQAVGSERQYGKKFSKLSEAEATAAPPAPGVNEIPSIYADPALNAAVAAKQGATGGREPTLSEKLRAVRDRESVPPAEPGGEAARGIEEPGRPAPTAAEPAVEPAPAREVSAAERPIEPATQQQQQEQPGIPPGAARMAEKSPEMQRYLESEAYKRAQLTAKQGQQQGEAPARPAAAPPAVPPPPPPRAPRDPTAPIGGDADATRAATNLDNELHKLTTVPAAHAIDYINRAEAAAKEHPGVRGEGGQQIYEALEKGTFDQLPKKMRGAYTGATEELTKQGDAIRDELIKRKLIDKEPVDPNYVHRVVKSEPIQSADPTVTGRLPGMYDPTSTKELAFRGAQSKDGGRLVISSPEEGKSVVWINRKIAGSFDNPKGEPLKTGDKFTYHGKEFTVDRGRTAEIEQHGAHRDGTPIEYHKNAFLSAFDYHRQMTMMKNYHDLMERIKDPINSPIKDFMTRSDNEATMNGWKQSNIPEMKGIYLHPDLEQVLHNNYNPGFDGGPRLDWLRAMNQFAVRSIFWNPVPHSMNALMHYVVARGWDWLPLPSNRFGANWAKSVIEGFKSAITQDELLQDLNKSGASLVMSKIDSQNFAKNLGHMLSTDLRNNPGPWEQFARNWGLGRGIDAYNLIMNSAQRALWTFSDALMASRVRELEMNRGMTREQAIEHARVHMPDYRLPIRMFGSTDLVRAMSDQRLSIFGRYHMGVFNSLGRMTTDLISPKATAEQRTEALGNAFALAALGFVVKPVLDGLVQKFTGVKEAETRPRGPLAPLTNAYEVAQGKKDMGMALSNIFTFSPGIKQLVQTLSNRDFAGRHIIEPGSSAFQKAAQYGEYSAGNLFSPYGTFGPTIQPGTAKGSPAHEFLSQVLDVKVPTARQIKGQKYGEQQVKKEEKQRAKRPRGLIEYGARQTGFQKGGPVEPRKKFARVYNDGRFRYTPQVTPRERFLQQRTQP